MRGNPGPGHMPPHMMHQFHQAGQQQQQQQGGFRFSWMNVIPIYTVCIVGYAIYIFFKGKFVSDANIRC